jgi:AbrB family looped-hinge helix DNA binding protein
VKILKILGQEGRITIPYEARIALRLSPGSIVSFEVTENEAVIRREKTCSGCSEAGAAKKRPPEKKKAEPRAEEAKEPLLSYLDGLTATEQMAALIHLTDLWVRGREREDG